MKQKPLSGHELIRILCNRFGFVPSRQNGSHISLVKYENRKITVIVPDKKDQLPKKTFSSILKQAQLTREKFIKKIDN